MVEKPRAEDAPYDLAIMGRYLLLSEIFEAIQETPPGRNDEIQITDALSYLLHRRPLYAYEFEGARWDVGTLPGWLETTIALALREPDIGPRRRNYLHKISSETANAALPIIGRTNDG